MSHFYLFRGLKTLIYCTNNDLKIEKSANQPNQTNRKPNRSKNTLLQTTMFLLAVYIVFLISFSLFYNNNNLLLLVFFSPLHAQVSTCTCFSFNTPFSVHSILRSEASKHAIQWKRYCKIPSHHFQSSLSRPWRWIHPTAHQLKNCLANGLAELNLA